MNKLLLLFILVSSTALAQITITSGDLAAAFAVGSSTTIHTDTMRTTIDIGSPGGGNNWDFQGLQTVFTSQFNSIDPATSPYIGSYPSANVCDYNTNNFGGSTNEIWTYAVLGSTFDVLGSVSLTSAAPGFTTEISNNPYRRESSHPMTFNTQWSNSFTQTLSINGTPINTSSVSLTATVDAYGTMTLPGGATYDALRLREEMNFGGMISVSYSFLAKNGAQVSASAVLSSPPNSGSIEVDGTDYYGAPTTTAVDKSDDLPVSFSLKQNYPNPFNPSTKIEYTLPEASFVELKIFDVLGNEVATLIDKDQVAGVYRADFNGEGLASGLYIAQLQAGKFTNTIKMLLMK